MAAVEVEGELQPAVLTHRGRTCCGGDRHHRISTGHNLGHLHVVDPPAPDYTAERIRALLPAWRRLRAHFEHRGWIEEEEWGAVLDIERMLTALGNYRLRNDPAEVGDVDNPAVERRRRKAACKDATQAAEMIAAHMLLGWSPEDSRYPNRAKVLARKIVAFGERYLAGASFDEADRAFEEAG